MPPMLLLPIGTRPEAIKTAPVLAALRAAGLPCHLQLTGQQPDLAEQVLPSLGLRADGRCPATHTTSPTPATLRDRLLPVLRQVRPRLVLVQGDTSSALAGALAAQALQLPIAHIEAGLRTYDPRAPYPEELYRQQISALARWHFAPTPRARDHLLQEGVPPDQIFLTGNTGIDTLHATLAALPAPPPPPRPFVLITVHRRETLAPDTTQQPPDAPSPLHRITSALAQIARAHPTFDLVLPAHPNPRVAAGLAPLAELPNVRQIRPVPYPAFIQLMRQATALLTDSGGLQEEAPVLGKPLLILRDLTERPEGVEAGTARLVGTDPERIVAETHRLLTDPAHLARMSATHSPYGDGQAAPRIAAYLQHILSTPRPTR